MKTFESIHFFRLKYIIFISIISMLFFQLKTARAEGWTHLRTMKKEQILLADETSGIIMTAFNDENTGIACLFDKILFTYDGGRNWKPAEVPLIQYLNNIEILDSEHAWVSASFEIRKTDTGIDKWQNLPNFGPMYESGRFSFITPSTGWYAVCRGGTTPVLAKTNDGGRNWIAINAPKESVNTMWAVNFVSEDTGFLLLFNGKVYRTDDAGGHWRKMGNIPIKKRQFPGDNYGRTNATIRFTDNQNGTMIIYLNKPRGYTSFITSDGGCTWTEEILPAETKAYAGSVYLSRDRKILTITDLENSSVIMCKRGR